MKQIRLIRYKLIFAGFKGRSEGHRQDRCLETSPGSRYFNDRLARGIGLNGRRRQHRSQIRDERHGSRCEHKRRGTEFERSLAG